MKYRPSSQFVRVFSSQRPGRPRHHHQLGLELLDQRLALAGVSAALMSSAVPVGTSLRVDQITPIQNVGGDRSLSFDSATQPAFSVRVDRQLNQTSLGDNDFQVEEVASDGSWTSLPSRTTRLQELLDPTDPTGQTLTVSFAGTFDPGTYRLVLLGSNSLGGLNETETSVADQVLNTFTVGDASTGPTTLLDLGNLQSPGTTQMLPVAADPETISLTRFVLSPSTSNDLTARFDNLDPSTFHFNLYNADQQLIFNASGDNLASLDQNLVGGTYFLGVYQTADSATPIGSIATTFSITAESNTAPIVTAITPVNFNEESSNSDSLVVQFAGLTLPAHYKDTSTPVYSLTDGNGKSWDVTPTAYDPTTNELALRLPGYLPTGHYSLMATPDASSSTGDQQVFLGGFDSTLRPLAPGDLGTIFPENYQAKWGALSHLGSGQSTLQQFSIVQAGHYDLATSNNSVGVRLIRVGSTTAGNQAFAPSGDSTYYLQPGVYELVATNASTSSQTVAFAVLPIQDSAETLSLGGVGQMPATSGHLALLGGLATAGSTTQADSTASSEAPDRLAASSRVALVESTGSFSLLAMNQTPVGALSLASPAVSQNNSDSPATSATMALALNSTIFVNPAASPSTLVRSLGRGAGDDGLQGIAPQAPGIPYSIAPAALDALSTMVLPRDVTDAVVRDDGRILESLVAEAMIESAEDPAKGVEDQLDAPATRPLHPWERFDADSSDKPFQIAGLASPLGVVLGGCMIYFRLKANPVVSGLTRLDRLWPFSKRADRRSK